MYRTSVPLCRPSEKLGPWRRDGDNPKEPTKKSRTAKQRADAALVGDVMEGYKTGRSALWYWRQASTAVILESCKCIRSHKWLSIRGLAIGWIFALSALRLSYPFMHRSLMGLLDAGMISRRTWGNIYPITSLLLGFLIAFSTGWIVARTHRPYSRAIALLFLMSVMIAMLPSLSWFLRLLRDTFDNARYIPAFVILVLRYVVAIVGTVLGGMFGAESVKREKPELSIGLL